MASEATGFALKGDRVSTTLSTTTHAYEVKNQAYRKYDGLK